MGLDEGVSYVQAGEAPNGANGLPGEDDVLNRGLKNLIAKFDSGDADTQVRRINFKISGAQLVEETVISDDVVYFNQSSGKFEKAVYSDYNALGIIDVENLIIYSYGEYTFKNINNLVAGKAYHLHIGNDGELVANDNLANASSVHIGVALGTNKIEINKFVNATFSSVTIDDLNPSISKVYSSSKIENLVNDKTKIYYYSNQNNINSLAPNPSTVLDIPLGRTIIDNDTRIVMMKVSNSGINSSSTLAEALTSSAVLGTNIQWDNILNKPNFANVATSGSYEDLSNTPNNASSLVDGFMSKTDKNKLNGIEAGATKDQTANQILDLIKTVDGANSELDADVLDGMNPEYNDVANSIVRRDSNKDSKFRKIVLTGLSEYPPTSNTRGLLFVDEDINNNLVAPAIGSKAQIQEWLGVDASINDDGHLFGTNGYQKMSNGLILQWGRGVGLLNLPVTFPNAFLNAQGTQDLDGGEFDEVTVYAESLSQIRVSTTNSSGSVYWFAIGY